MKIHKLDETAFKQLDRARRIGVDEFSHVFGALDLGELGYYGLAWRSELITPIVEVSVDRQKLWIGVDQQLAAINLQDGHLCLSLALESNLSQILVTDDVTAVLTELELILFNSDCSIRALYGLPDLSESVSFSDSVFTIRLFNGSLLTLNSQIGLLAQASPSANTQQNQQTATVS